jgi:hypothetical protein
MIKVCERVPASYFIEHNNKRAYQIADEISRNHPHAALLADWYAGLATWRIEHYGLLYSAAKLLSWHACRRLPTGRRQQVAS